MRYSPSDYISKLLDFSSEGVETLSRLNLYDQQACMIFGVGQDPAKISEFTSWAAEHGIKIKALVGKYEGRIDHCFITEYKNHSRIGPFLQKEESVLVVDRSDAGEIPRARLVYQDGKVEEKGTLKTITKTKRNSVCHGLLTH